MDRQSIVARVRPAVKKLAIVGLMFGGAAATVTGCSEFRTERGRGDVPIGDLESTSPLIVENADQFPNQSVKCVEIVDKKVGEDGAERVIGNYLIFSTTHTETRPSEMHVERLPDGVPCPAPGDLAFGR